jgi:hypothetical protein
MFAGHFGGHATYYHPGCESFVARIPDRAASIVILAGGEDVSIEDLMSQLLAAALEP